MFDLPVVPDFGGIDEESNLGGPTNMKRDFDNTAFGELVRLHKLPWEEAKLYRALLESPSGLSQSEVAKLFSNKDAEMTLLILDGLYCRHLAYGVARSVNGRLRVFWVAGELKDYLARPRYYLVEHDSGDRHDDFGRSDAKGDKS